MTLYAIDGYDQLYADALASNGQSQLLFLSVWGLDTALQELMARLTLPPRKGGLSSLRIETLPGQPTWHFIPRSGDLIKLTGRSATPTAHVRGLVQLWLYDPLATRLDYANHRALLLRQHGEPEALFAARYWATIQAICPVPLLSAWHDLVNTFEANGWCKHYAGVGVDAYALDFSSEDVEKQLTACIQSGQLTLPTQPH